MNVRRAAAVVTMAAAVLFATAGTAPADPAAEAAASAFGITITGAGQDIIPPTPQVSAAIGEDASETLVDVPAEPLAVSGTVTATATAHEASDVPTALTVSEQEVAGPYNATGVGVVENLEVLVNQVDAETSLLTAAVVRAEAAAVCVDGEVSYTANSEIVDLQVAGEQVPLNAPLEQIIDGVNDVLEQTTLNQVVDIERNVVTENPDGGIAVDALVVTLLSAAGDAPLAQVRIAHGEVGPLSCASPPECSDTADNDGDGVIDAEDPGCHTDGDATNPDSYDPEDDDEADVPQCSDTADNDGDGVIDAEDPGCHTDGDATNPDSYDPEDDDETDTSTVAEDTAPPALPRTGTDAGSLAAGGLALGLSAAGITWLRRRLTV